MAKKPTKKENNRRVDEKNDLEEIDKKPKPDKEWDPEKSSKND